MKVSVSLLSPPFWVVVGGSLSSSSYWPLVFPSYQDGARISSRWPVISRRRISAFGGSWQSEIIDCHRKEEGFERVTELGDTECGGEVSADYQCSEKGLKMVDFLVDQFFWGPPFRGWEIQARDVGWGHGILHERAQEHIEEGKSIKDNHIHRLGSSFPLNHAHCFIRSPCQSSTMNTNVIQLNMNIFVFTNIPSITGPSGRAV